MLDSPLLAIAVKGFYPGFSKKIRASMGCISRISSGPPSLSSRPRTDNKVRRLLQTYSRLGAEIRKLREAQASGELVIIPSADAIKVESEPLYIDRAPSSNCATKSDNFETSSEGASVNCCKNCCCFTSFLTIAEEAPSNKGLPMVDEGKGGEALASPVVLSNSDIANLRKPPPPPPVPPLQQLHSRVPL